LPLSCRHIQAASRRHDAEQRRLFTAATAAATQRHTPRRRHDTAMPDAAAVAAGAAVTARQLRFSTRYALLLSYFRYDISITPALRSEIRVWFAAIVGYFSSIILR